MFFRREKARVLTFDDYLNNLRKAGFEQQSAPSGKTIAILRGCAAVIRPGENGGPPRVDYAGTLIGNEIAMLIDGGFQKFLQTRDGRMYPALATHLKALHAFQEDLKEALGITSLYNEALGTVSNRHMYDRVEDRDSNRETRPWEEPPGATVSVPAVSK